MKKCPEIDHCVRYLNTPFTGVDLRIWPCLGILSLSPAATPARATPPVNLRRQLAARVALILTFSPKEKESRLLAETLVTLGKERAFASPSSRGEDKKCHLCPRFHADSALPRDAGLTSRGLREILPGDRRGRRQDFGSRKLRFQRSAEKIEQHSDPLFGRQQTSDKRLEALERALGDSDRLPHMNFGVEGHDLFFARFLPQVRNDLRIQCRHFITEVNDTLDSGGMLYPAVFLRIDKLGKQISREHCLNEPNGSSAGRFPITHARREAGQVEVPT
jgi:hypothetical protein